MSPGPMTSTSSSPRSPRHDGRCFLDGIFCRPWKGFYGWTWFCGILRDPPIFFRGMSSFFFWSIQHFQGLMIQHWVEQDLNPFPWCFLCEPSCWISSEMGMFLGKIMHFSFDVQSCSDCGIHSAGILGYHSGTICCKTTEKTFCTQLLLQQLNPFKFEVDFFTGCVSPCRLDAPNKPVWFDHQGPTEVQNPNHHSMSHHVLRMISVWHGLTTSVEIHVFVIFVRFW